VHIISQKESHHFRNDIKNCAFSRLNMKNDKKILWGTEERYRKKNKCRKEKNK
jgi:hypothetical protein